MILNANHKRNSGRLTNVCFIPAKLNTCANITASKAAVNQSENARDDARLLCFVLISILVYHREDRLQNMKTGLSFKQNITVLMT